MNKTYKVAAIITLIVLLSMALTGIASANTSPTISIVSVVPGEIVTIQTYDFPPNLEFTAKIGEYGTMGVGGEEVGKVNSDKGGIFTATFNIPAKFKDTERLAIRLENAASGYYAYNWFENTARALSSTTAELTATTSTTTDTSYTGYPAITITKVNADEKVSVAGMNFPKEKEFTVLMDVFGFTAMNGIDAGKQDTGKTGDFEAEYTIPSSLKGIYLIAIRLEDPSTGYYAYNWFYNATYGSAPVTAEATTTQATAEPAATAETAAPATATYSGYPEFQITAVVKDAKVSISTTNLVPGDTYDVLLASFGTQGAGGTKVGTIVNDKDFKGTSTFDLPKEFAGTEKISLRLDGKSGYYAYNWFYNATYP